MFSAPTRPRPRRGPTVISAAEGSRCRGDGYAQLHRSNARLEPGQIRHGFDGVRQCARLVGARRRGDRGHTRRFPIRQFCRCLSGRKSKAGAILKARNWPPTRSTPRSPWCCAGYCSPTDLDMNRGDYELVALGSTGARLESMIKGETFAGVLNPPFDRQSARRRHAANRRFAEMSCLNIPIPF